MNIFNEIASGATAGSMLGGNIAVLTRRSAPIGAAVGGLVGAGCGLVIGVGKALLDAPRQLLRG